ncbi:MAG TPA: hypothetical protein ENI07_17720 [Desulfobacterales bacterium]|nr:hypothetical protein [Desulfobacterales bacterium]
MPKKPKLISIKCIACTEYKDCTSYDKWGCPAVEYARSVLDGKDRDGKDMIACRWVKLACERFIDDLKNGKKRGLYFDIGAADLAIKFFSYLRLWKGREYKGKHFLMGKHFQFIISNLMGWKRADHTRRFRIGYVEMGRKQSKTSVAGGLGAYFFIVDGEEGAEIYSAAVTRDQAKLVWENIKNLTKPSKFAPGINYYTHNLSIESTWSKCEPLSSDSKSLDGLDTHFASLDELHAHPDPRVHDLIIDSLGSRSQPMVLIITTAGFDQAGVCYQRREYLTQILKKTIADDSFFGIIYTLDTKKDWPGLVDRTSKSKTKTKEDDWQDEDVWVKAMPSLWGITKNGIPYGIDKNGEQIPGYMAKLSDVREKALYAASNPAALNNFQCKRLNIWTQQLSRWIDLQLWDSNFTSDVYVMEQ